MQALSGVFTGVVEGVGHVAGGMVKGVAGIGHAGSVPLTIEILDARECLECHLPASSFAP